MRTGVTGEGHDREAGRVTYVYYLGSRPEYEEGRGARLPEVYDTLEKHFGYGPFFELEAIKVIRREERTNTKGAYYALRDLHEVGGVTRREVRTGSSGFSRPEYRNGGEG